MVVAGKGCDLGLVQLQLDMQASGEAATRGQYSATMYQSCHGEGQMLNNAQQQGQGVPIHGAGCSHLLGLGLARLLLHVLLVGVDQVGGMPSLSQRR